MSKIAPILIVLASCASYEGRVRDNTGMALRHAGRAIHYLAELEGELPSELSVWGKLWQRDLIIHHSPYFQLVHDPHHLQVSDYWESPIRYSVLKGSVVLLSSAGPNRRFDDEDDVSERIPPPEPSPRAGEPRIGRWR